MSEATIEATGAGADTVETADAGAGTVEAAGAGADTVETADAGAGARQELEALRAVRLSWAAAPDDVWQPATGHVDGLQHEAEAALLAGMDDAWESTGPSPLGLVLSGQRGVGKTHLLGWIRRQVQAGDGYFFLGPFLAGGTFWRSAVHAVLDGLWRPAARHRDQLSLLFDSLAERMDAPADLRAVLAGEASPTREHLDGFVAGLRRIDRQVGTEAQDTARALILYAADGPAHEVGRAFLSLGEDVDPDERAGWGLQRGERPSELVLRDLSRLLALTGPTVVAVDQVDTLLAATRQARADSTDEVDPALTPLLNEIADGLMALRELTRRTLSVVSCLPTSWELVARTAVDTAPDRFRVLRLRGALPHPRAAAELVATRLLPRYARVGVRPPYATWPVHPQAFTDATRYTARALLRRVDDHIAGCLADGRVRELARLDTDPGPIADPVPTTADLDTLDERFYRLRESADVSTALAVETEDTAMPALLRAGLTSVAAELRPDGLDLAVDPLPSARPPLHARLRLVLDEASEDEAHWCFRAVGTDASRSVQGRLRQALAAAGTAADLPGRALVLLRTSPWPDGEEAAEALAEVDEAGAIVLSPAEYDLRTFAALSTLLEDNPPGLLDWLISRRPAGRSGLLRTALRDLLRHTDVAAVRQLGPADGRPTGDGRTSNDATLDDPDGEPTRRSGDLGDVTSGHPAAGLAGETAGPPAEGRGPAPSEPDPPPVSDIPLGRALHDDQPIVLSPATLREHVVVIAGAGSDRPLLVRRLVEECALQGVSSVVLDPGGDFARLGDAWPEPPGGWGPGDAERSAEYLATSDVVLWRPTPGDVGPAFPAIPEVGALLDAPDELTVVLDAAAAGLVPRTWTAGSPRQAELAHALLRDAIARASLRGGGLDTVVELLPDVPADLGEDEAARQLADELAGHLAPVAAEDPLFAGGTEVTDPGVLLTPEAGKRARVCVVSLAGLPGAAQRQGFVHRLELALFTWLRRHPAVDRPLAGLLVMDEAHALAPARGTSVSGTSTLALAEQGRRHGLGLVVTTGAPRALDPELAGSAATVLVGLLNAPGQIEATRDLVRARGLDLPDVPRLPAGQYVAMTPDGATTDIRAPTCLSHHPGATSP